MTSENTLQKWAFYIDPETKAKLQDLAKGTMRSQAATIRILIHEAYAARATTTPTRAKKTNAAAKLTATAR